MQVEKQENVIASVIVDAAIEVHRTLGGPGLWAFSITRLDVAVLRVLQPFGELAARPLLDPLAVQCSATA